MAVYPIFGMRTVLLLAVVIAIGAAVLGMAFSRGVNVFKKQGVAWVFTIVMVFAAIGIGYAKAPFNSPVPEPAPPQTIPPDYSETVPSASADSFVWDNARVLSDRTEDRRRSFYSFAESCGYRCLQK